MIGIRPEICIAIKKARREAKLNQIDLAAEVGCKQSALSMFEQGDPTKLNDDVVEKLAKKFNIDLHPKSADEGVGATNANGGASATISPSSVDTLSILRPRIGTGFCPNPNCPSNRHYTVEDRTLVLPNRAEADPIGGTFCALCGESLIRKCPNCGAPVHAGAICSLCGEPYVAL